VPELRRVARPDLTPIRGPEELRQWVDDGRGGGYSTMTEAEEAEANQLQVEARERNHAFALSTTQHALHADRERRQREAEEARKARGDPLVLLRQAHTDLERLKVELTRAEGSVVKARSFRDGIESHRAGVEAALQQADAETTGHLIESFTGTLGNLAEATPSGSRLSALRSSLSQAERELELVDDALEELTRDRDVIQTTVARCRHAVAVAARECLLDVAVTQASEIIAEERVLAQRRADLKSLGQLLDDEARRLFARRPSLPPIISRALYPSGSRLTGAGKLVSSFDWRGLYERYCTTQPEPETQPEPDEA